MITPTLPVSRDDAVWHEVSHAVVALALGLRFERVRVEPSSDSLADWTGAVDDVRYGTEEDLLVATLAGVVGDLACGQHRECLPVDVAVALPLLGEPRYAGDLALIQTAVPAGHAGDVAASRAVTVAWRLLADHWSAVRALTRRLHCVSEIRFDGARRMFERGACPTS